MITQQKDTEPVKKTLAASSALAILMGLATPAVAAERAPQKTVGRLDTKPLADLHPDMAYAIQDQAQSQASRAAQESAYKKAAQEADRHKAAAEATAKARPSEVPALPDGTPAWVAAINKASTKIDTWYLWGGTCDDRTEGRCDCSGLVQWAYGYAGITMPRVANDQYAASRNHPKRSELRPGDLVFYGPSERGIHHVGIYVGNGTMLHAPKTGRKVGFDSINYMSDYYGATRVS